MRGISRESAARGRERLDALGRDLDERVLRRLGEDLLQVVHLLHRESRLRRVLSDPALSGESRSQLLAQLLGDRVSNPATQVVEGLVAAAWAVPRDLVDAADELAAQAMFTAAERDGSLDDVEDELFRFSRLLGREPRLRAALTDPGLPADRKRELLEALLGDKVRAVTLALVLEVVLYPRGRTIDRGLEEYSRMAAERRERLVARVRTAVALSEEQQRRLADALAAHVGHQVHLNIEIDPDLMGGLTVRVGDQLFDGSIAHRIGEARHRMAG